MYNKKHQNWLTVTFSHPPQSALTLLTFTFNSLKRERGGGGVWRITVLCHLHPHQLIAGISVLLLSQAGGRDDRTNDFPKSPDLKVAVCSTTEVSLIFPTDPRRASRGAEQPVDIYQLVQIPLMAFFKDNHLCLADPVSRTRRCSTETLFHQDETTALKDTVWCAPTATRGRASR